ncbi:methyltransferase domain-containing protein [Cecembia calidifontis]|jgi:2-polyprenyl-3-methyl-5-hydroxy-6-metoxy-1,4-benzoquinol methylase|uniref:Methyltransferase family protein n=1 Tax=Cecembia calidifontis TaxID=1187080 RepID=A0A4Q7P570_9BACT|nr:methyltransferase domain-containing protein [Cecembia calidifontis]RZS95173.1 methyltransferase family protein [Cecembia calidifontis]
MKKFAQRSFEKEWMDDFESNGQVLEQTLKELKTINKLLGGNHVTTSALHQVLLKYPQKEYKIADLGCGGGDMIRIMAEWANENDHTCQFVGIDANPNIIEFAKNNLSDIPSATFQIQNVFAPEFENEVFDIITCTLFTHHFTDQELIGLFRTCLNKARLGIVVNDLHRHPVAYASIRLLTKFFSKSEMVKNDGPLSVKKAFVRTDLERILQASGIKNYQITWHWAFRWRLIIFCQ